MEYADFVALVQADMGLMEGAALCFAARADEVEVSPSSENSFAAVDAQFCIIETKLIMVMLGQTAGGWLCEMWRS